MEESDSTTDSTSTPPASSLSLPEGKDYHAFICFNIADQEWLDQLIAHLESPQIGIKCVDHRRDFHPGKTTVKNIEEFIEKSWKYVLILSPDFVASEWCSFETDIMVTMSREQREECIIPVLLKPCIIPLSLKLLTYVDVSQSDRWREKLVKAIRRTDISSQKLQRSKQEMLERTQTARENITVYQTCVDNYRKEKRQLELERKCLESDVHNAFSATAKRIIDELERQRTEKVNVVSDLIDKRLAALVRKSDMAKNIIASAGKDLDDSALKKCTGYLDEYEELERKQKETTYTGFVVSDCLVDRLAALMSDVGYLREMDTTQIKSQEDRDNFLKDIAPSWAILPQRGELTPWSFVRCPSFQLDSRTVRGDSSILPGGLLGNQPPSQPHPQSDRRLREYKGFVGTTRFTHGWVYMWANKVAVNLAKKLEERSLVFGVSLSAHGEFDDGHTTEFTAGSLTLYVHRCTDHRRDSVCLKVYNGRVQTFHRTLFANTTGQLPTLEFCFLLDTIRHRWTVYDVTEKEEITTVEDIEDVEEFTPMFGIYDFVDTFGVVGLSLVTGTHLNLSDDMIKIIQKVIE